MRARGRDREGIGRKTPAFSTLALALARLAALMALFLRKSRALFGAAAVWTLASGCYTTGGGGTDPPAQSLYYPVGLAVSQPAGRWLVVVNSDFDLQYSGGTLQTFDLAGIRQDAVYTIAYRTNPAAVSCSATPPTDGWLGLACAQPADAAPGVYWADPSQYWRSTLIVGAFATDLLELSVPGLSLDPIPLFSPIRGTTAVLSATLDPDPDPNAGGGLLTCGDGNVSRCGAGSYVGSDPNALYDTRQVVLSGEPFGIAQTHDGTAFLVTSESDTTTSVFATDELTDVGTQKLADSGTPIPSLQFVLSGLPAAGTGIAEIPHDPGTAPTCSPTSGPSCVRPAFLETNHSTAQIDLLRYYSDDGTASDGGIQSPGGQRAFLQLEGTLALTATTGSDERGIVIDDSPRAICHAAAQAAEVASGCDANCVSNAQTQDFNCGFLPANMYVASRTPPALLLGQVGNQYDPDALSIQGTIPLPAGPSRVYRAPVIASDGTYSLRIFVTCFDSDVVIIYDPATQLWDTVHVGQGPFAMTFDPFPTTCWGKTPAACSQQMTYPYRFAYVANFTQSFLEVIDLDNSQPTAQLTYESVVYAIGQPTAPKGQ
ncbi:MAG: hypothetical protein ABTD50_08375 [Polyangiaceae bacterium]|jgi:hypothetical protein